MSTEPQRKFVDLVRTAIECRDCFTPDGVSAPFINVAQPRWVGAGYWKSSPRIVILMINPGQSPKNSEGAREFLRLINGFREGTTPLQSILEGQRESMEGWGKGRFTAFYIHGLGLDFDEIAFANVAWCATAKNIYPGRMLQHCFKRHTGPLLELLRPDVILASGRPTHAFERAIFDLLPMTRVIKTLHYAHREGRVAERRELKRLRSALTGARRGRRVTRGLKPKADI